MKQEKRDEIRKLRKRIKRQLIEYKLSSSLGKFIDENIERMSELITWLCEEEWFQERVKKLETIKK